jgi:hypothetical protein
VGLWPGIYLVSNMHQGDSAFLVHQVVGGKVEAC